jgi:chromosome segregation ATPase
MVSQIEQARAVQEATSATSAELQSQVQSIAALLATMETSLERNLAAQEARLKALEEAPVVSAEQIGLTLASLQSRIEADLAKLSSANSEHVQEQIASLQDAVSSTRKYNSELSAELERAQGYTTKVLGSLVSVVDGVTQQVANGGARPQ